MEHFLEEIAAHGWMEESREEFVRFYDRERRDDPPFAGRVWPVG